MRLRDKENLLVGIVMGSFLPTEQKTELIEIIRKEAEKDCWIPVTERLPEKDGTYIVFTESGCVTTARWYSERDFCNYRGEFIRHEPGKFHRKATHWMPLPEPQQEENNG